MYRLAESGEGMNQREAFEKWARVNHSRSGYTWMDDYDTYAYDDTRKLWECWQAAQQAQWLPIESAPRNGKPILCGWDSGVEPCVCYWCEVVDGWSGWHGYPEFDEQPTHWMPLPPEPNP